MQNNHMPSAVTPARGSSPVGERCPSLEIGLGLGRVLAKGPLDLLVEVGVAVIDVVNVLGIAEGATAAEVCTLVLPDRL